MNLYPADNLEHLEHVSAESVRSFLKEIRAVTAQELGTRKLVIAIGTGGTISMKITGDGKWVPDLNFEEILRFGGEGLSGDFLVKGFDAFHIDSSQMNYTHIRDMAIIMSWVYKNLKCDFAGFLVLHGTDTMTYSASAISIMMGQGLPFSVVFTGAQKPIQEPLNDAATNLKNALYTLEALHDNDMAEVIVVMGDMAVLGTSSEKVDDSQANAFDAPLHKYVARYNRLDYPVRLAPWLKTKRGLPFEPRIWSGEYAHTLLVRSHLGLSPDIVKRQVEDGDIRADILYSYGGYTVYNPIVDAIMPAARKKKIPVFVVSPVNAELNATYESVHNMIEQGVVPLYMTLSAALAKIEIAIRLHPDNPREQEAFMKDDYVGEVPKENSRYIAKR